jgi:hypothetical protein
MPVLLAAILLVCIPRRKHGIDTLPFAPRLQARNLPLQ